MCPKTKDEACFHDMCKDCCSKQKYEILKCPCCQELREEVQAQKQEMQREDVCSTCLESFDHDCCNQHCESCCNIQAIKEECKLHDLSIYGRKMVSLHPHDMARSMISFVGEMHIIFRNELKTARYDWFKPIYSTPLHNAMIKANRELQIVKDNGGFLRGVTTATQKSVKIWKLEF